MDWAFDTETGRFLKKNGGMYLIDGREALKQKIYKTLKTRRGRYAAYPNDFGSDALSRIMGMTDLSAAEEIIRADIEETLLAIEGVRAVRDFAFVREDAELHASFLVQTIYGNLEAEF